MKILYVNWAPLWRGAEVGGGVNVYSQSMAVKLAELGHSLFSISAGFAYDFKNRAYIKKGPDFMGVKNYEIFNAPNIAPGFFNYENPMQDVSEPVVEALFGQFIEHIKPEVVHFHNIEGFSVKCIKIATNNGCRVIFSLHNYHPVCNQIYLLYKDKSICEDFNNGLKCLDCISPPSYNREVMRRRAAFHIHRLPFGERIWRKGLRVAGLIEGVGRAKNISSFLKPLFKEKQHLRCRHKCKNIPDDSYLQYAQRRKMIIQGLNHAHLIHAVSDFVKDFYIRQGIKPDLVTTCHIGNKMAEIANTMDINITEKKQDNVNNPLKIVFLGISSEPKGLPFLLETLLCMDKDKKYIKDNGILKQISLHIHARGIWGLSHLIKPLSEKLGALEIHDGYAFSSLPDILSGMNYGIVPPLWYDNAPQVVFEMMAMKIPVIGAAIGGIPDFVKDMYNGILFEPGNKTELAEKIEMVVKERNIEYFLRSNIPIMKTPELHTQELERFYNYR